MSRLRIPWRDDPLPRDERVALALAPGEKVIASGRTPGGGWVAATRTGLHSADRRLPWTEVVHARWVADDDVLLLEPAPGSGPMWRIALTEAGRLPETVHERVMASIVLSRRVALPGGGVRLVARRAAERADLQWQVVPDAGTDLDDPATSARVDAALADLRAELG